MSLPYTNEDLVRAERMIYRMRNNIRGYFRNMIDSAKNAAKLLGASVASCIHGIFPTTLKYTALAVCLSIVENDLMHNKIPSNIPQGNISQGNISQGNISHSNYYNKNQYNQHNQHLHDV
jgi:hypothetical protein